MVSSSGINRFDFDEEDWEERLEDDWFLFLYDSLVIPYEVWVDGGDRERSVRLLLN